MMNNCTVCETTLEEGVNWKVSSRHNFCRFCFNIRFNKKRMYLSGKYISKKEKIHKEGHYKTLEDAWSHKELDVKDVSGEIYIIFNSAFKGWVKVGMSISAEDRLRSYQTSDPFRGYILAKSYTVEDRHEAEKELHVLFDKHYNRKKEWFEVSVEDAGNLIEKHLGGKYEG